MAPAPCTGASFCGLHRALLAPHNLDVFAAVFFVAGFFTAMNSSDVLLRLVQAVTPPSFVFSWVRFLTAPCVHCRLPA
jgi:hypothetical protein